MTDKLRGAAQQAEREAFERALAAKPDARFWNTADAMFWAWQARAALAQQDAQKKHKPLFAEMIAQHPGLAEELAQQDAQAATCKQDLQVDALLDEMLDTLPYNSPDYWIGRIREVRYGTPCRRNNHD